MKIKNVLILISLLIIGILCLYLTKPQTEVDRRNILFNVFSSVTVVFIVELISSIRDWIKYSFLDGTYNRIEITNKLDNRTPNGIYVSMMDTYTNVNSVIILNYKGDGEYTGIVHYKQGMAKITIDLNQNNRMIGQGTYQYIDTTFPDLGTYQIQVDIKNKKRLYVHYTNLLPNGLASGYEIWEK